MTQATSAQATPQAPTPPATPEQTLDQQIEKTVNDAVNQALQGAQAGANGAEAGRLAAERVQEAMARVRANLDARRNGAIPGVAQGPVFPSDMIPPQVVDITLAFFITVAVIIIGLPLARAFARRMDRRGSRDAAAPPPELASRLDRIEQGIDAMAIEVERISEGQRFTTRLMSEMRGLPAPNPMGGRISRSASEAEPIPEPAAERRA
jgi:hypothetical protein